MCGGALSWTCRICSRTAVVSGLAGPDHTTARMLEGSGLDPGSLARGERSPKKKKARRAREGERERREREGARERERERAWNRLDIAPLCGLARTAGRRRTCSRCQRLCETLLLTYVWACVAEGLHGPRCSRMW